ncbi:hypothetical protein BDB00DRAFT_851272 [Zychaea mexicana]|uniref:uncharacterized protein n=1 Tax=Zychaea mexicana TaxID=64656 RepID=UPI0022FE7952|nr:uncharacterized protein BDB00DRAFT_851272 [Zychaea mexicana]KAI9485149.1 hypothetical protein BDB00DRAFT_851272 [Zychaea mexicana]
MILKQTADARSSAFYAQLCHNIICFALQMHFSPNIFRNIKKISLRSLYQNTTNIRIYVTSNLNQSHPL